ncbi:PmoA family protein [Catenuloplanes sp. NPDC051500]|uniref:PmoA family protein n=1 Tax=Catenuloplanes sp. NPDC051500 TaxID=3363959 RepID=UPI0037A9CA5D
MAETARLTVGGIVVARLQDGTDVEHTLGPRPYLHPVSTLAGVPVTDAFPEDHRWHLGVSVAMQDVAGTNLWGGRTYVRDRGYTWLDDHGRIVDVRLSPTAASDALVQTLHWLDPDGALLITEDRTFAARPLSARAWSLEVAYTLAAPADRDIPLGSPATNGRPDAAGYGGFFWRCAPGPAEVFDASGAHGEATVNGGTADWVAFAAADHTLIFSGLGEGDHWFARTGIYPGVCVALAWEKPLIVPAGGTLSRRHTVIVADGALTPGEVASTVHTGD